MTDMHRKNCGVHDRNQDENVSFVMYTGQSMYPTLREPAIMEIVPYRCAPVRVGDVVYFLPPETKEAVVHRVIRVTPAGIATRGDNNAYDDSVLLQPQDIFGRVLAAWRGKTRRRIVGGTMGRVVRHWLGWRRILHRVVTQLLHPLYCSLAHWGGIARLLPAPYRPHVVVFRVEGRAQRWLLWGRRVIGRYDDRTRHWQIQRPFRLLVDEHLFPQQQKTDQNHSST